MACLVPQEHLGKVIRCPKCKQTFSVRTPDKPDAQTRDDKPDAQARDHKPDAQAREIPASPSLARRACEVGNATSPGRVRKRNEDSYLVEKLTWASQAGRHDVVLAVICDGMGGHDAGDRASTVAVGVIASALAPYLAGLVCGQETGEAEPMLDALDRALWEANRAVSRAAEEEAGCTGMGATAVAAIVLDHQAAICHVGDCRAYLYRAGAIERLTRDQTLVERMLELGTLTEREAKRHPAASQVTQALGRQYELEPSRKTVELQTGDRLILACDGLHAHLDAEALAVTCGENDDPAELAAELVEQANQAGGSDNCTVIVVDS
jgi:protein phosphatase